MKKRSFIELARLLFVGAVVLISGCGYQFGSIAHPQLKNIAVAAVTNETIYYNGAAMLRGLLCERIMSDGSLKLVSESTAQSILYARITEVKYTDSSTTTYSWTADNENFTPNQLTVNVSVEYSVVLPGKLEPLISARKATGSATFKIGSDREVARANALRQALFAASKVIVDSVVEGW